MTRAQKTRQRRKVQTWKAGFLSAAAQDGGQRQAGARALELHFGLAGLLYAAGRLSLPGWQVCAADADAKREPIPARPVEDPPAGGRSPRSKAVRGAPKDPQEAQLLGPPATRSSCSFSRSWTTRTRTTKGGWPTRRAKAADGSVGDAALDLKDYANFGLPDDKDAHDCVFCQHVIAAMHEVQSSSSFSDESWLRDSCSESNCSAAPAPAPARKTRMSGDAMSSYGASACDTGAASSADKWWMRGPRDTSGSDTPARAKKRAKARAAYLGILRLLDSNKLCSKQRSAALRRLYKRYGTSLVEEEISRVSLESSP